MAVCDEDDGKFSEQLEALLAAFKQLIDTDYVKLRYNITLRFHRRLASLIDKTSSSSATAISDSTLQITHAVRNLRHTLDNWHVDVLAGDNCGAGESHDACDKTDYDADSELATDSQVSNDHKVCTSPSPSVPTEDSKDNENECFARAMTSSKSASRIIRARVCRKSSVDQQRSDSTHEDTEYSCPLCVTIVKRPSELAQHLVNCHSTHTSQSQSQSQSKSDCATVSSSICDSVGDRACNTFDTLFVCRLCHVCWHNANELGDRHRCAYARHDPSGLIERLVSCGVLIRTINIHHIDTDTPLSAQPPAQHQRRRRLRLLCLQCGGEFRSAPMFGAHVAFCRPPPYTCHVCHATCATWPQLATHKQRQHGSVSALFPCPAVGCELTFRRYPAMQKHVAQRHYPAQSGAGSAPSPSTPFLCRLCGKIFVKKIYLTHHQMRHHHEQLQRKYVCEVCGAQLGTVSALNTHVSSVHGRKQFVCVVCSRAFTRKDRLMHHLKLHSGDKPHRCCTCGKSFVQRCKLNEHIRRHRGEKRFRCTLCNKHYAANSDLRSHLRRIHNMDLINHTHTVQPLSSCLRSLTSNASGAETPRAHRAPPHFAKTTPSAGLATPTETSVTPTETLTTPIVNADASSARICPSSPNNSKATPITSAPPTVCYLAPPSVGFQPPSAGSVCAETSSSEHLSYQPLQLANAASAGVVLVPAQPQTMPAYYTVL